jgi:outer membrane receptor protein involved in Fe transport
MNPNRRPWLGLLLLLLGLSGAASAQNTTATVRGTVTDAAGQPVPNAAVIATETATGFSYADATSVTGSYNLTLGPGAYQIEVSAPGFETVTETLRVQIGQAVNLEVRLGAPGTVAEEITVAADAPVFELRTSEVATNVTQEQIENLPQGDRNFLNFAALAPGVRLSLDPFRKEVQAGALPSQNTNVFIDGASYKNDVLQGGVVGQDASRGNPFPQNAVQEFRVLSNNYKAEYQKASSAVISAVTKSGTNELNGEVFGFYQDKSLVAADDIAEARGEAKPEYERWQAGLSLGGPIVSDQLHYFVSYEANRQDRANRVSLGSTTAPAEFRRYEGNFTSPFRSSLGFGKISWQPAQGHLFDLSGNLRQETDVRSFGGQTSFESAENVKIDVTTGVAKYQFVRGNLLADTTVSYQQFKWNPTAENPDLIGREYQGIIRIGGRDTDQRFEQTRLAFREDVSLLGGQWLGEHVVKLGVNADFLSYDVQKRLVGNPVFIFRPDVSFDVPVEARYGSGNPDLSADNEQYGLYVQDDWQVNDRLTINLGVRWDYETDMLNNDYVTPDRIRTDLSGRFPSQYFTDGNDRPEYKDAFQPRIGFSWDATGAGKTVVFGGVGRYYDRVLYNDILDERFRLNWAVRTFRFSTDGKPRDGQPTLLWRPEYLSQQGLDGLIASGRAPNPEVFLVDNGTKPPVTDQWSVGVRQTWRNTNISATYTGSRSKNGFTYLFGTRRPDGTCCESIANYSNVLISSDDKEAWYDAFFLTIDRPYTSSSRWGYSLAYTWSEAEQIGGDLFSLDFPSVQAYPRYPTANDETHRVVATGIFGLPWDVRLSTIFTLGSGVPYTIADASRGFGPNEFQLRLNEGRPEKESFLIPDAWAYRTVDLRLQKDFVFGGDQRVGLIAEVFNVFDYENFGCYNGFIAPTSGAPNADFGKPGCLVEPGRRLQFGLSYRF